MWHDSRIRETWFVYMWPCLYVEFVTHLLTSWLIPSHVIHKHVIQSHVTWRSLKALQSCHALHTTHERVTNSIWHMNESRTPHINGSRTTLLISLSVAVMSRTPHNIRMSHELYTTYERVTYSMYQWLWMSHELYMTDEWVTYSLSHWFTNYLTLMSLSAPIHFTHSKSNMNQSRTPHINESRTICSSLSVSTQVTNSTHESVTKSTCIRVTNYMQLPQRFMSQTPHNVWISHELHM